MKITIKQLERLGACDEAVCWLKTQKNREIKHLAKILLQKKHFDWANWFVTKLMTRPQAVQYSIYAAELCLSAYEEAYPKNGRPRNAIDAAKKCLRSNTEENRFAARSAAESARSAAESAAESAESARAAAESARFAAWSAAESARAAAAQKLITKAFQLLGL